MNEKRTMTGSVAAQIMTGAGPAARQMRYQFIDSEKKPGYANVYDVQDKKLVMELCDEHARMIYIMYKNLHDRHWFAADEFMYGHIMGYTMMMVFADKYPKVDVIRKGGEVTIRMRDVDGTTTLDKEVDTSMVEELKKRLTPKDPPK